MCEVSGFHCCTLLNLEDTSTTSKRHIPIPTIGVLYLCVHAFQVLSLDEDGRLKVLPKSQFL